MRKIFFCWFALLFAVAVRAASGPETPRLEENAGLLVAVSAADDERQAATLSGDRARLEQIFSDELRYAHSSGKIDNKDSYIESLVSHQTVYESFEYKERTFSPVAPGVVLMSGRVLVRASNDGQKVALDLNYLAVWREEKGQWRFLAWQSCRNPVAVVVK